MKNLSFLFSAIGRLRLMAYVEGVTLLVLVAVGVPLKYLAGHPELVSVLGPIHGVSFLIYLICLVEASVAGRFKITEILKLFVAAFIPLAFISSIRLLARKEAEVQAIA